jgi:hypothetical protein
MTRAEFLMTNVGQARMELREAADRMPVGALVAAEDRLERVRAMLTEAMTVGAPAVPPVVRVGRSGR